MKSVLLLGALLLGQGQIEIPSEIRGKPNEFISVKATAKSDVQWLSVDSGIALFPSELLKDSKTTVLLSSVPGTYRLYCWTVENGKPTKAFLTRIVVEGVAPKPPDPKPDDPKPPDPSPSPSPFPPGGGLRVLMIYESADANKPGHTPLFSATVRNWLRAKANGGFRVYDKDTEQTNDSKDWMDAMKRPRTSLPWLVIGDGQRGYEGPLPPTVEETMGILSKFGGN